MGWSVLMLEAVEVTSFGTIERELQKLEEREPASRLHAREEVRDRLFGSRNAVQVGRFIITGLVGRGGMGVVFCAHDPRLDRRVAIKLLDDAFDDDAERRVIREARSLAKVTHPNVVSIYEAGSLEGRPFIAMEFVNGVSLATWSRTRQPKWSEHPARRSYWGMCG